MIWGILAMLVVCATFVSVYFLADRTGHPTLSSMGVVNRKNRIIFTSGVFASGVLFFLFVNSWLLVELNLPDLFWYIAAFVGLVCHPVAAFVPYRGAKRKLIHDIAVYCACGSFIVMGAMIAKSDVLPAYIKVIILLTLASMLYLIFEFKKSFLTPKFILVQGIYIGSFYFIVLLAALSAITQH